MRSTTQIGDDFEATFNGLLTKTVKSGDFFLQPEQCKFFRKKGYYSRDRQSEIIFDISIEVYLPGADTYSLLVLVECKDTGRPVSVDDAEEFFAKLQQISPANSKGIIASTNAFQSGTLKYARAKGIGLVRYFPPESLKWHLYRVPGNAGTVRAVEHALTTEQYRSEYATVCCMAASFHESLFSFLHETITGASVSRDAPQSPIESRSLAPQPAIPFIPQHVVEAEADRMLCAVGYEGGASPLEDLVSLLQRDNALKVILHAEPSEGDLRNNILGRISFSESAEIRIYKQHDEHRGRSRFTLAHELGHFVLNHSRYIASEYCQADDFDSEGRIPLPFRDLRRLEWQANCFASSLLLPREPLLREFHRWVKTYDLRDKGRGLLFVDSQPQNQATYYAITSALKAHFHVSRTALHHRLVDFGVLGDERDKPKLRPGHSS